MLLRGFREFLTLPKISSTKPETEVNFKMKLLIKKITFLSDQIGHKLHA